jgi:hypothetical protein
MSTAHHAAVTSELEAALPGIVQTDPVALERYREDR